MIGYPVLGVAYLWDTLGADVEGAFFTGFTVIFLTQLAERTRGDAHSVSLIESPTAARRRLPASPAAR